jgi:hypothetical protein
VVQFGKGDNRPIGHGTHKQRGAAVTAGYNFGITGVHDGMTIMKAALSHVLSANFELHY